MGTNYVRYSKKPLGALGLTEHLRRFRMADAKPAPVSLHIKLTKISLRVAVASTASVANPATRVQKYVPDRNTQHLNPRPFQMPENLRIWWATVSRNSYIFTPQQ